MAGLTSLVLFTADPWESAMPALRVIKPAQLANVHVLCGYDRNRVYPERIAPADLVVIQRDFPRIPGFQEVVAEARWLKKPIVYEIDDMLFEIPDSNIHHVTYQDALLRMMQAARLADAVIASMPSLVDYVGQINPNIWRIPYFLDDTLWPLASDRALASTVEPVVIGYMGGRTHLPDLESISTVLEKVLEKYGERVRLRFWGGPPPESLRNRPQVEWIEIDILDYVQFATYFATQSCDIFIAPLQKAHFNQFKSSLKFLEYSSLGIPGVFSKCEQYQEVVRQGVNGFLADSDAEWLQCLTRFIEDPILRRETGMAAQTTVKQNWLLTARASDWLAVYDQILSKAKANAGKTDPNEDTLLRLLMRAQEYQNQLKDANIRLEQRLQQSAENEKRLVREITEKESIRKTLLPVGGKNEAFVKKTYQMLTRPFLRKK